MPSPQTSRCRELGEASEKFASTSVVETYREKRAPWQSPWQRQVAVSGGKTGASDQLPLVMGDLLPGWVPRPVGKESRQLLLLTGQ